MLVKEWFKTRLLPELKVGTKIVLDNASFHKGNDLEDLVEKAGCQLWYLPTYSPDLNPIEQSWSVLKNVMKKSLSLFDSIQECVDYAFLSSSIVIR